MPGAYVMINTLPGMEKPVLDRIAQIPGVVSVEGVYAEFDLIVSAVAELEWTTLGHHPTRIQSLLVVMQWSISVCVYFRF
jgi:hypothetical protein